MSERPDPVEVLRRVGGSATWRDLVQVCGRHAVRRAVEAGGVKRLARGAYALAEHHDARADALRLRGVVSHASAAEHWGFALVRSPAHTHVTVPRHRVPGAPGKGVRLHWADLAPEEVDGVVTSPLRTVLDCARALSFADALAVADSALRDGAVDAAHLVESARRLRGAGASRIRALVAAADARAESPLESALRAIVLEAGMRDFEPQVVIRHGGGSARVDLADRERRIVLEADSFAHHGSRSALANDCLRYTNLVAQDWRVLRFAWEHVMFSEGWVARTVTTVVDLVDSRAS